MYDSNNNEIDPVGGGCDGDEQGCTDTCNQLCQIVNRVLLLFVLTAIE